jgi:hypothetical protein
MAAALEPAISRAIKEESWKGIELSL